MSRKAFVLSILILIFGVFIYLKIQTLGSPDSLFNQTTRFSLGKHPVLRTVFGLHNSGDARAEYLEGKGPISIEWFVPQGESVDPSVLKSFAALVSKYTGREAMLVSGGAMSDGTIDQSNLAVFNLEAGAQSISGTKLSVFFTDDYSPRPDNEISSTYGESAMKLSLSAHAKFLQSYQDDLNQYLLSSMLHEFGNQIGMQETATGDSDCIMNLHAGLNGKPLEASGLTEPQDFCPAEVQEINSIKAQLQN